MSINARFEDAMHCKKDDRTGTFHIQLHDDRYFLPTLYLDPVDGKQPYITEVSLEAQDGPVPLLAMLQSIPERRIDPPYKLTTTLRLPLPALKPQVITAGRCQLVVNVHYFNSDSTGKLLLTQPECCSFVVSLAFSDANLLHPSEPSAFLLKPKIRLPPAPLMITVNGEAARLHIEVIDGAGSLPSVVLGESLPQDADLHEHLLRLFKTAVPVRLASTDNTTTWEIKLVLNVPDTLKKSLFPTMDSPALKCKIIVKVGPAECEHDLLIESPESPFDGWIAIDFGTSSSTATLFNKKKIIELKGLPHEQSQRLQQRVVEWLSQTSVESLPGQNVSEETLFQEWRQLLDNIGKSLAGGTGFSSLVAPFENGDKPTMYDVLRQIEQGLTATSLELQRAVYLRLNKLYREVLRIPPLKELLLVPVELEEVSGQTEILSEAQVDTLDPLCVRLGAQVRAARLAKVAQGEDTSGQFHQSLKRYLGKDELITVRVDTEQREKPVSELIQAALAKLLDLAYAFRRLYPGKILPGPFRHAVVTYPTVAPPTIRQDLERLLTALGISNVKTDYDEAISAAIFYLMREFSGDLNIGLEALKARCRPLSDTSDTSWSQNVMVLDIGGGTTDIALIQLKIEDRTPTEAAGRTERYDGKAGRYYVIIPRLLGSSGHMQLGGDLITLKTFLLIKAAIVDRLLVKFGQQGGPLGARVNALTKPFVNEGRYIEGSLCQYVLLADEEEELRDKALNAIEEVLSTRWKGFDHESRSQSFQLLWDQAEEAKLHLGRRRDPVTLKEPFVIEATTIRELLRSTDLQIDITQETDLTVSLSVELFEKAVTPVIEEAVKIANGLLKSRLPERKKNGKPQQEPLDWLILSGKSCHLALVERTIRRIFSEVDYFVWNPERVTFDPEFAKLGTSIGACYAEHLWQLTKEPLKSIDILRKGFSQYYFDIENLFFFLPCSFTCLIIAGKHMLVFEAGKELYQLDHEPVGRARSKWEGAQLQVTIFRKDYDDVDGLHWANFDADREVAKKLDLPERRGWQKDFHYQLEVDYKLRFRIYLCCGEPHYMVSPDVPSLDVRRLWSTMSVAKSEEVGDLPARHSCYDQPHDQSSVTHDKTGDDWFDAQGKLGCTIAVDVFPGGGQPAIPGAETVLFKAGDELTEVFHTTADNDRQVKGLISKPLYEKAFRRDGSLDFYARRAEHESWQLLGSLRKPPPGSNFPKCYSVTLDAEGHLRLHMGLVPYWMTPTLEVLKSTPGYVYRQDMEANPPTLDEKRDPFAGIH